MANLKSKTAITPALTSIIYGINDPGGGSEADGKATLSSVFTLFSVDEDDMSSDSAIKVPTQQSTKAYVDTQVGTKDAWGDAVDADVVPDADGTRDLGSTVNRFAELHVDSIDLNGTTMSSLTSVGAELAGATSEAAGRAAIGAASPWLPDWVSGRLYGDPTCLNVERDTASLTPETADSIIYIPRYVPNDSVTLNALVFEVITAVASSNIRACIYEDNLGTPVGGAQVTGSETGNVSSATTGVKTPTISCTLTEGLYWIAIHFSGAVEIAYEVNYAANGRMGHSTASTVTAVLPVGTQTYGTLPTTAGAASWTALPSGIQYPYVACSVA